MTTVDTGAAATRPRVPMARIWTALALAAALILQTTADAQNVDPSARFKTVGRTQKFKPAQLPAGVAKGQRVAVVVVMSDEPVATARAASPTHKLDATQHESIRRQIADQHAAIEPAIQARGGRVLAHYHDALNGMKISIARERISEVAQLPGVVDVVAVPKYHKNNASSVPFIGAPAVWQGNPGFRGDGIKIAIIDTGIDYTHANFGGPGTVDAFTAAAATSTAPADPALFGPKAPKVKGGIDLVGDAYDADTPDSEPQPDPNPLDCNGHGSHTAGSAAGFGVGADGKTYSGPYNEAAYQQTFQIGPGVAPKADLYAVRVFGCDGSTNVVTDAIDWAVHNDMDVISMSLGSDFGDANTSDAIAATNATKAGVVVVAASGNEGFAPYMTSTPGSGNGVISVAAIDTHENFAGALLTLNTGKSVEALNANGVPLPGGATPIYVLRTAAGAVSLGCDEAEYVDATIAGKLVVTKRGTCDRVARAKFGQKHGAAAVAMINTSPGYPPFEGPIPDVTIPFLGVLSTDEATLTAASSTTYSANTINNPGFRAAASFSSGGPRFGDSVLKPNVAAPGVSIFSTAVGTGNGGLFESGTSMATPHVAGVAALTLQAHPQWSTKKITAAVVESGDPLKLSDYAPRLEGSGLVQPVSSTKTQAVVLSDGDHQQLLSFGFEEIVQDLRSRREVRVHNEGSSAIVFNVSTTQTGGAPHNVHVSTSTLVVGAHNDATLNVSLTVPVKTIGTTHDADGNDVFQDVSGYVTLTPASSSMNGGIKLTVPYYLVPRARSNVLTVLARPFSGKRPTGTVALVNLLGAVTGNADFYAWGLRGEPQGVKYFDTRAVGVQTNPISETDSILVFAINTFKRFSNAAGGEFDVLIDVNADGTPDYDLVGIDLGALTTGSYNGEMASALINLSDNSATIRFLADTPTDGSTVLLPVLASDLGLTPDKPRFTYSVSVFNLLDETSEDLPGSASFNAFAPSITNALFIPVAPNKTKTAQVAIDPTEWAITPALGLMVVVQDNFSGSSQAELIRVKK